ARSRRHTRSKRDWSSDVCSSDLTDTSGFPHHVTGHPDTLRLTVLVVPAGITDMRGGLHDYLPMVRGIGQRFLITGHARREHDLTQRATGGTVRRPTKYGAVLEHQRRGHALGHRRCHSCSSILIVWTTYTRSLARRSPQRSVIPSPAIPRTPRCRRP